MATETELADKVTLNNTESFENGTAEHTLAEIMIVDDLQFNINLLIHLLNENGYEIRAARDGTFAIESARRHPPDLILLDIMMPNMDGFQVCRELKRDEATKGIPVIFISALDDTVEKVKAFQAGGVDYIARPFESEELMVRIKTHLTIQSLRRRLEVQNQMLKKEIETRESVEHVIAHNLRSPLHSIISLLSIFERKESPAPSQLLRLNTMRKIGFRMLRIIEGTLDVLRMEKKEYVLRPESIEITKLIREVIADACEEIDSRELSVSLLVNGESSEADEKCFIYGEELLCTTVFSNLLQNAIEASPNQGYIQLRISSGDFVRIEIHNQLPVPGRIRQRFFDKYVTADKFNGTGLGTYIARLSVEVMGGTIEMHTSDETGTTVKVRLPAV